MWTEAVTGLFTLTVLEIVLGIDNIIFISILASKLPAEQRPKARQIGLGLAVVTRILLLLGIAWVAGLTKPWFDIAGHDVSGRDLILIGGGLFLLAKSAHEIHDKMEPHGEDAPKVPRGSSFAWVIVQILLLDLVFSLDSVITAIGMTDQIPVMVAAVIISVGIMLFMAGPIGDFVNRHPSVKMLALSFLLLIGTSLVAEGIGHHIPKGYIYFSMAFSAFVEFLNLRSSSRKHVPSVPSAVS